MSAKIREDAWIDEQDRILTETVISHIRNGSTQLAAFEETGNKLNRTPAACGFRWNKELRKHYANEINEAKLSRVKQKTQREVFVTISNTQEESQSPNDWDYFLSFIREQRNKMDQLIHKVQSLENENSILKERLEAHQTPQTIAQEDYQALVQILNRAKGLGALKFSNN